MIGYYDVKLQGWIFDDLIIKDSFAMVEPFATILHMFQTGEGDEEKLKLVLRDALDAFKYVWWWRRHSFHTAVDLKNGNYHMWKPGEEKNLN